jgi:hypothetical protein
LLDANGLAENGAHRITLGPNPTTNTLNVGSRYVSAKGTDLQGRSVMNTGVVDGTLDVSTLPVGAYSVELTAADKSRAIGRFVKQ